MRLKKLIKILFFVMCAQFVFGQGETDIIRTNNYFYALVAPEGWVADHTIRGLESAYYPQKSSWYEAPTVMYVNIIESKDANEDNIFNIIDNDLDKYYINSPDMKVEYGEKLHFENGDYISMVVYLYGSGEGPTGGHSLAIAYIPQFKEVMNIVMSSDSREEFEKNIPVFRQLVQSYDVIHGGYAVSKQ